MKRSRILLFLALSLGPAVPPAAAALPLNVPFLSTPNHDSPSPEKKPLDEKEASELQTQTEREIAQARAALAQAPADMDPSSRQFLVSRLQTLENLAQITEEILDAFESQRKIEERSQKLAVEQASWKLGSPPQNFTADFNALDKLHGQSIDFQKNLKNREQIFKARQEALAEAKNEFQNAEQERRKAKENLEKAANDADKPALAQTLTLAQMESRRSEMKVALRELELGNSKSYREFADRRRELNALQTAYLEKRVRFTAADLQRELNMIEAEENNFKQTLEKTQNELQAAEKEYTKARAALAATPQPSPAQIEEVEAKRLAQAMLERKVDLFSANLKGLKRSKAAWKRRYELLNDKAEKSEILLWEQQTRSTLEELRREEDLANLQLNSQRNAAIEAEEKIRARAGDDSQNHRWLRAQKEEIQKNVSVLQDYLAHLSLARKLQEKLLFEEEKQVAQVSWKERFERVWNAFLRVWNFELTSVDDSPITVSKIVIALVLIIFGIAVARHLSRILANRVLPRFGVTPGVAAALRSLAFYVLLFFFILFALQLVRVPITLFAVLGGAAAIGIGFGSQNLMNNFISGLILLIERPIKVGDIIEMEQNAGMVERIGGRSTQIRTFNNIHMIVPNSVFLEKTVVNWNLSDNRIRTIIKVGVAYGSDTALVAELLKKAAVEHNKVMNNPEPLVLLTDFGNDALIFELIFWIEIQAPLDRRTTESELRLAIDRLFRKAGICIAFPQRDLHLFTESPLTIRMAPETASTLGKKPL